MFHDIRLLSELLITTSWEKWACKPIIPVYICLESGRERKSHSSCLDALKSVIGRCRIKTHYRLLAHPEPWLAAIHRKHTARRTRCLMMHRLNKFNLDCLKIPPVCIYCYKALHFGLLTIDESRLLAGPSVQCLLPPWVQYLSSFGPTKHIQSVGETTKVQAQSTLALSAKGTKPEVKGPTGESPHQTWSDFHIYLSGLDEQWFEQVVPLGGCASSRRNFHRSTTASDLEVKLNHSMPTAADLHHQTKPLHVRTTLYSLSEACTLIWFHGIDSLR